MNLKKRFSQLGWQLTLLAVGGICGVLFLFIFKLGNVLPGASVSEINSISASASLSEILSNPLFLPHKIGQFLLHVLSFQSITAMRLISALTGVVFVVSFYTISRRWYSTRIAILTASLLACSSWLLPIARNASPSVLYLSWFFIIYILFVLRHSVNYRFGLPIAALLLVGLLYTPGSIYIFLALAVWKAKDLPHVFSHKDVLLGGALGTLIVVVCILPLVIAMVRTPSLLWDWLLIPDSLTLGQFLSNIADLPAAFFYQATADPEFRLGALPLLDIFSGTMMLLGIYSYRYHLRMERTPLVALCLILSILLVGVSGSTLWTLLLPFVYVLIGSGISFLLEQWFNVFPKNPVARTLGTTLVSTAVIVAGFYHISRFYIAWANAPETKAVYSIKQ